MKRHLLVPLVAALCLMGCDILNPPNGGNNTDCTNNFDADCREIGDINGQWEGLYYTSTDSGVFVENVYITITITHDDNGTTGSLHMWAIYEFGDNRGNQYVDRGIFEGDGEYFNGFINIDLTETETEAFLRLTGFLNDGRIQGSIGGRSVRLERQ